MNMNSSNMEKLLNAASKSLKMNPDELKDFLQKGDIDSIAAKMEGKDAQKLRETLKNPDVEKMIKNSPEMAEYLNKQKE